VVPPPGSQGRTERPQRGPHRARCGPRQTVVGLAAGTELGEHNAPHAATLQVLHGRVRVTSPSGDDELGTGILHLLTHERHAVLALEDSVFLLTTVTGSPIEPIH
jgi:quercetin dioxygenase-like cupin family protein